MEKTLLQAGEGLAPANTIGIRIGLTEATSIQIFQEFGVHFSEKPIYRPSGMSVLVNTSRLIATYLKLGRVCRVARTRY
jgi:hypothetical protein